MCLKRRCFDELQAVTSFTSDFHKNSIIFLISVLDVCWKENVFYGL